MMPPEGARLPRTATPTAGSIGILQTLELLDGRFAGLAQGVA